MSLTIKNINTDNKVFKLTFKLVISGALLVFIGSKIIETLPQFNQVILNDLWFLYGLMGLCLTIVNWGIEARKWQILSATIQPLTYYQAFGSVLSGLSTGLITPNRLGNFIGRNIYIKSENKKKAIFQTQLGNLAQFLSSIILGTIAIVIIEFYFDQTFFKSQLLFDLFAISLIIIGVSIYFQPKLIFKIPGLKKMLTKDNDDFKKLIETNFNLKWRVLFLSLCRFIIFIIQFNLIFSLFIFEYDWIQISLLSATSFLITTLIPSIFFGKLLVRESSAILVFGWANINIPIIILSSFLIWLINLAIPGIIGLIIWLKKKR